MYKYIALGIVGFVAACAAPTDNPVSRTQLVEVEAGYGVVLSVAANYRELYDTNPCTVNKPLSSTNYCASRSVVVIMQETDKKVQGALVAARNFIKDNPKLDASGYIRAAMTAVNDFKAVQAKYGVK